MHVYVLIFSWLIDMILKFYENCFSIFLIVTTTAATTTTTTINEILRYVN